MYVVELVAPGTVNTMPQATLDAVHDHGQVRGDTVREHYREAGEVLDRLGRLGIEYDEVVDLLEREGIEKFEASWNELIESLTGELEAKGADVSPSGSTSPAGEGPAAGDRAGSGR